MTEVNSRADAGQAAATKVVIVGAGFTGLAAGYELAKRNLRPTILEAEPEPGGLAGTFEVGNTRLERFYHHWFTNDRFLMELAAELGLADFLIFRHARTGLYYGDKMVRKAGRAPTPIYPYRIAHTSTRIWPSYSSRTSLTSRPAFIRFPLIMMDRY
jgi:protoporphyrinogen oxidase